MRRRKFSKALSVLELRENEELKSLQPKMISAFKNINYILKEADVKLPRFVADDLKNVFTRAINMGNIRLIEKWFEDHT